GQQTFVAIYAQNCPEWTILTLALIRHSMIVVPLYDTLGENAASYILAHY
uniref:long-chain-fatty-acid--CoA ligase n=1 Tax=Meloidogyne javanica TaxID=6303 RepID=A0A915MSN2_MELJA